MSIHIYIHSFIYNRSLGSSVFSKSSAAVEEVIAMVNASSWNADLYCERNMSMVKALMYFRVLHCSWPKVAQEEMMGVPYAHYCLSDLQSCLLHQKWSCLAWSKFAMWFRAMGIVYVYNYTLDLCQYCQGSKESVEQPDFSFLPNARVTGIAEVHFLLQNVHCPWRQSWVSGWHLLTYTLRTSHTTYSTQVKHGNGVGWGG